MAGHYLFNSSLYTLNQLVGRGGAMSVHFKSFIEFFHIQITNCFFFVKFIEFDNLRITML